MKKFIRFVSLSVVFCVNILPMLGYAETVRETTGVRNTNQIYQTPMPLVVEKTDVAAPILDPIYDGDTQVSGILYRYGYSSIDGRKIYLTDGRGAAVFSYNGKWYMNDAQNQNLNYQIEHIDADHSRFVFTMPNQIVFREGDSLKSFIIPGSVSPGDPQFNGVMAPEAIVLPASQRPVKAQNIEVQYVDELGNEIHEPKTISGNMGESYDATTAEYQLTIPGYSLDLANLPTNRTGTFSDQTQTVVYVYKKETQVVAGEDVEVRYVDELGNEIHESKTISGNMGESYDATTAEYQLTIPGYSLDLANLPANRTGTFTDQAQTVVYVYKKEIINEDPQEDSDEDKSQPDKGSGDKDQSGAGNGSEEKGQSDLGEDSNQNSADKTQVADNADMTEESTQAGNQGVTKGTDKTNSANSAGSTSIPNDKTEGASHLPQTGTNQSLTTNVIGSLLVLGSFTLFHRSRKRLK
jgi:LPXTG-motif cell wall-anchored protein